MVVGMEPCVVGCTPDSEHEGAMRSKALLGLSEVEQEASVRSPYSEDRGAVTVEEG